ncbi:MAG TPA: RNase adapter RapZ, partial [Burkholderiales bacterium]
MKFRNLVPLLFAAVACVALAAESPQEFARRIEKDGAVHPVVNLRNDGSFGSVSIGVQPAFVADRAALEPVLAEIGKYATAAHFKIDVLSPKKDDVEYIAGSPEMLLRRFSVARRPHPLRDRNLEQAIADERRELDEVRTLADLVLDTTNLSPHDLRRH